MKIKITFKKDNEILHTHVGPCSTEEELRATHDEAFHGFRLANPDVLLFDGVEVGYAKG